MTINAHNSIWLLLALVSLAAVSGCCCQAVPLPGENQCPTDARRLYCSPGEEAVRRCPCGPDSEFYGLKPTCWREWPEGWHCNGYEGMPYVDRALCGEPVAETFTTTPPEVDASSNADVDVSNPFRDRSGAPELPLPPQTPQPVPTQPAPAKAAPVQMVPPQPTPVVPPALEKIPTETAPAKEAPAELEPSSSSSTTNASTDNVAKAAVAPPETSAATPVAPVSQVQATMPQPMPVIPVAVKMTATAPILIPPQNDVPTTSVENPTTEQVASPATAEKKPAETKTMTSTPNDRVEGPAVTKRVEEHLFNNLRL